MPAPRGIIQWVDQELHKSRLLPRGAKLLVAVSGGTDSVALLRLLVEINRSNYWDWQLVVGHVDHGIRGKASSDDAAWVRSLARQLKLRFIKKSLKLPATSSEALARQWRFNALAAMVRTEECLGVVMGHHLDDQAETVLMRIFRGCGVEGLEGMRPLSETFGAWKKSPETLAGLRIYRPLLQVRRERLRQYLQSIKQTWREDATNASPKFARNQVRAKVLPLVEKIWPGAVEAVGRLARIAGEVQSVMREHEEPIWQGASFQENGAIELQRTWLRMAYPAVVMQVLRDAIELAGGTREIADFERIAEAVRLIRGKTGGKTIQMGRGVAVEMKGQIVRIVNYGTGRHERVGGGSAMNKQMRMRWLALIIGLTVGVRIALAIAHGFWFPDSADYDALARTIFSGDPYQVNHLYATRMPGYPVFVALIYAFFGAPTPGDISLPVMVAQGLTGGLTVWLTYLIGRRINVKVALVAAFLAAIDPLSIGFSATMLTEPCYTSLLMLALWLSLRLIEHPSWIRWISLGIIWGIGVYFRASSLWCIVPIAAWVAWMQISSPQKIPARRSLTGVALSIAIVALTLLPWCLRNYQIFHTGFFRLTTLEGISLYEAVYPAADGSPQQHLIKPLPEMEPLNEAQRNDEWSRRAWGYVFSDPRRMLKLGAAKIARTWAPWFNTSEIPSRAIFWGMTLFYIPVYLAAIFGIASRHAPKHIAGLLLAPIFYFTMVHALYLGSVRYRVPLMPLVCIFAAAGIVTLWQRIRGKPQPLESV